MRPGFSFTPGCFERVEAKYFDVEAVGESRLYSVACVVEATLDKKRYNSVYYFGIGQGAIAGQPDYLFGSDWDSGTVEAIEDIMEITLETIDSQIPTQIDYRLVVCLVTGSDGEPIYALRSLNSLQLTLKHGVT